MDILKPQLSSIELRAVVLELQHLVGGKIDQIYEQNDEFTIRIHSRGKEMLCFMPGKYIYIKKEKPAMEQPGGFCMQLRKNLTQSRIASISQLGAQRIVAFDIEANESTYRLIIELFAKGNVLLCEHNVIKGVLHQLRTSSRELFVGKEYKEPPLEHNVFEMDEDAFIALLHTSTRDSIVTALAMDVGVGGMFAEEICARAHLDKKESPKKAHRVVYTTLHTLLNEIPRGYIYDTGICAPVKLSAVLVEEFDTFNQALEKTLSQSADMRVRAAQTSQYNQKLERLNTILYQQEQKLHEIDAGADEFTKKGDMIYEKYTDVKVLLDTVEALRKEKGWDGVKTFLAAKELEADLKEKKVKVEL